MPNDTSNFFTSDATGVTRTGKGHHPLTYRHLREHVLDEVGGRLGHAPGRARRAEPATLAGEGDQEVVTTSVAVRSGEAASLDATVGPDAAAQIESEHAITG